MGEPSFWGAPLTLPALEELKTGNAKVLGAIAKLYGVRVRLLLEAQKIKRIWAKYKHPRI